MDTHEIFEAGLAVRRGVLGATYVDSALANSTEFNRTFQELITKYCWGEVWTRPGLDHRTRSMLNLAMLPALKQWDEFKLHIRGAINNGCTPEDIQEVLLQVTIYCGVPAGVEAFRLARAELASVGINLTDPVESADGAGVDVRGAATDGGR